MKQLYLVFLLLPLAAVATAQDRHTDRQTQAVLPAGQSPEALGSGTPAEGITVEILKADPSGYTRVRTRDGVEGWVPTQFLTDALAQDGMAKNQMKHITVPASAANFRLPQNPAQVPGATPVNERPLSAQTSPIMIQGVDPQAQSRVTTLEEKLRMLRRHNETLESRRDLHWYLAGAGSILVGMLIGLIIPKIRWPRKSWHNL